MTRESFFYARICGVRNPSFTAMQREIYLHLGQNDLYLPVGLKKRPSYFFSGQIKRPLPHLRPVYCENFTHFLYLDPNLQTALAAER